MLILIGKAYLVLATAVLVAYTIRHYIFALNRLFVRSRGGFQDLQDSQPPRVSVLIPMHNEEKVARNILDALLTCDYPPDRIEIIPIDDRSTDGTYEIVSEYAARDRRVRPLRRTEGIGGKPAALIDGIALTTGDILLVFDADYIPARGLLREIVAPFIDPEVGAVMGRVVPLNCGRNLLTRLLDLERSAGYQVDQQARHNLRLVPQYGGTVGGFRRSAFDAVGGFDPHVLAEDTDLTFRLTLGGWKVVYSNRCECYEEVPERWTTRVRQIRRWAIGHTQCFFRHIGRVFRAPGLRFWERIDGAMLLGIYMIAPLLLLALLDSLFLFLLGEMNLTSSFLVLVAVLTYNTVGNFASFFEIGTAVLLDGHRQRIHLLPFNILNFALSIVVVTAALIGHARNVITKRTTVWQKTERYRQATPQPEAKK